MHPSPLLLGSLVAVAVVAAASSARADGEAWFWTENRIPVVQTNRPEFPRLDWRVISDFRFNQRSGGLHQAFFRTGPAFYPTHWLFVAVNGTVYADRQPDGHFDQEARVELEPNLFGRLGDFTFNDRNRVEYRYRDTEERFRYRNQLRVNYAPRGARWLPYVWDEMLFDLSGLGFNQNRAEIGIARMLTESIRLDVGYMFRSRDVQGDWTHDHILNLFFFFDVPPKRATEPTAPSNAPPNNPDATGATEPVPSALPPPSPPPPEDGDSPGSTR